MTTHDDEFGIITRHTKRETDVFGRAVILSAQGTVNTLHITHHTPRSGHRNQVCQSQPPQLAHVTQAPFTCTSRPEHGWTSKTATAQAQEHHVRMSSCSSTPTSCCLFGGNPLGVERGATACAPCGVECATKVAQDGFAEIVRRPSDGNDNDGTCLG